MPKAVAARTMNAQGRIYIPPEVRKKLGLEPGDSVGFFFEEDKVWISRVEYRPAN